MTDDWSVIKGESREQLSDAKDQAWESVRSAHTLSGATLQVSPCSPAWKLSSSILLAGTVNAD